MNLQLTLKVALCALVCAATAKPETIQVDSNLNILLNGKLMDVKDNYVGRAGNVLTVEHVSDRQATVNLAGIWWAQIVQGPNDPHPGTVCDQLILQLRSDNPVIHITYEHVPDGASPSVPTPGAEAGADQTITRTFAGQFRRTGDWQTLFQFGDPTTSPEAVSVYQVKSAVTTGPLTPGASPNIRKQR